VRRTDHPGAGAATGSSLSRLGKVLPLFLGMGLVGAALPPGWRSAAARPAAATELDQGATRARMGRHGASLSGLARSVVLLDFATTARLARQVADDETIALAVTPAVRPDPAESFTALQEELRARARRLGDAAAARDDAAVADSFGEVAKTCVRCHRLYLRPAPRTRP
jgi:hypothetical protein